MAVGVWMFNEVKYGIILWHESIFSFNLLSISNKMRIFAKYRKRKYTCGTEMNYCYHSVTFTYFSYTQLIRF